MSIGSTPLGTAAHDATEPSPLRHFDLAGRTALITGAATGFGARFARVLAAAGARVLCSDINGDGLAALTDDLTAKGRAARAIVCDVASATSVDQMAEALSDERIDILVNNAGIVTRARRIHEITEDEWDRALDINLKGTFLCTRAVLPAMLRQGAGSIVNLSSVLGLRGYYPGFAAVAANYFASKAGIVGFTKQLAVEYAGDNIRANAICPAFHEGTELGMQWRPLRSADQAAELSVSIDRRTPLGRKGRPDELDGLIVYLAGDASSYVTGQVFAHDGGWMAA